MVPMSGAHSPASFSDGYVLESIMMEKKKKKKQAAKESE